MSHSARCIYERRSNSTRVGGTFLGRADVAHPLRPLLCARRDSRVAPPIGFFAHPRTFPVEPASIRSPFSSDRASGLGCMPVEVLPYLRTATGWVMTRNPPVASEV